MSNKVLLKVVGLLFLKTGLILDLICEFETRRLNVDSETREIPML